MFNFIKTAALSAMIGLTALAAAPTAANAQNGGGIYLGFGSGYHGANGGFHFGDRDRHHRPVYRPGRHACTPGQAVRKASRMGLRNVRIVGENRRAIRVVGRGHGHPRTIMVFAKAPRCPVIR